MKKCSFCGQEIASDATLCLYCHHAQPAHRSRHATQRISNRNIGQLVVALAAGVAAAVMVSRLMRQPATFEHRSEKRLQERTVQVSGTRNSRGIEVVNREAEPLTGCVVSISDRSRSREWRAVVQKLAPMEPKTVAWVEFRGADGTETPASVGETTPGATVECDSDKGKKSAALVFR